MAAKKEKIRTIASAIKGMLLVVEKGIEELKIRFPALQNFYSLVKEHRKIETKEEELAEKKESIKKKLIKIILDFPKLKGLQTELDNLRTLIYQTEASVEYNREPLKEALGEIYEGVVKEDLQVTIILTPKHNRKKLIKYLRQFFKDEETFNKSVKEEMMLRVDKKKLSELIKQEKVSLPKEAITVKKEPSWQVKTITVKPD